MYKYCIWLRCFHYYLYSRDSTTAEIDDIFKNSHIQEATFACSQAFDEYNLNVVYKPGNEMYISDTQSRDTMDTMTTSGEHEHFTFCLM